MGTNSVVSFASEVMDRGAMERFPEDTVRKGISSEAVLREKTRFPISFLISYESCEPVGKNSTNPEVVEFPTVRPDVVIPSEKFSLLEHCLLII
jgi:hypothetical protein